jgi:hypothetical protein
MAANGSEKAFVWNELDYRVDVCTRKITKGAHIEHL